MLRIDKNIKIEEEPIISIDIETSGLDSFNRTYGQIVNDLFKTANEVNRKLSGHTQNYIVASNAIIDELKNFTWDYNRNY